MNLNYRLSVQGKADPSLFFQIPSNNEMKITFNVARNLNASANACSIVLFGLSKESRDFLRQYRLAGLSAPLNFRIVKLEVGYGNALYTLFEGTLLETKNTLQSPAINITLLCKDNPFNIYGNIINISYSSETKRIDLIRQILDRMPNLELGTLQGINENEIMGVGGTIYGKAISQLEKIIGSNKIFIDNGVLHITPEGEPVGKILPVISNVLTSLPLHINNQLIIETLFLPEIYVGSEIILRSERAPEFNGAYIVDGVHHNGTINDPDGINEVRTKIFLRFPFSNAK